MYADATCTARLSFGSNLEFETKILFSILVAHVGDEFLGPLRTIWDATGIDVTAYEVAKNATEVFVTWVGKEGARIGDHAHESTEQTEVGESVHLVAHAAFLIKEPPAGTVLNLSRGDTVLEGTNHTGEQGGVGWIDIINNSFTERVFAGESSKPTNQSRTLAVIANCIATSVGPETVKKSEVWITDWSEVKLSGPTLSVI